MWRQRGKLAEAAELLDGGIEAARVLGNTHALVWGLSSRSSTALRAGDVELALAAATESVELCHEAGAGFHTAEAAADLAAALTETGDPHRAVELLLGSSGGEDLSLIAGSPRARYLEVLARAWLDLGLPADAERAAASAEAWAESVRLPMASVVGRSCDSGRRPPDRRAVPGRRPSARVCCRCGRGRRAGRGRALADARRTRTRRGRTSRTAQPPSSSSAAREFEARGAVRYRDEAERELRKLGRHIHHRTRSGKPDAIGVESLTERELQLARLVVDRKTNPEIAAELFLSKKTVETHLRNIFRKIGVTSRVELARAVEHADRES